jgi:hypothetical protein
MCRTTNRWQYSPDAIKKPSEIVLIGEINRNTSYIDPTEEPVFNGEEVTRYRISNPGEKALYRYANGHVEAHKGNQGLSVKPEMWKWW